MDKPIALLFGVLLTSFCSMTSAQGLTPEQFVRADVEARTVTLQGLEAQLTALRQGVDVKAQTKLAEDNRQAVETVFNRYGTTGVAHTVYGTYASAAITAWLRAHPEWQQQYDDLGARLTSLSGQIDSLRGGH